MYMKTIGIIVLVIGIIMTVFTGFNIVTKKKVVDFGPVEINKEEKTPIYWSPVTGGILIVIGAIILVADSRRRA
jgi:UDP-N-acetylmuramyl pentapeptide phosphotransferase/UDP-N-acetylglucosamine-1-phosphate transferase